MTKKNDTSIKKTEEAQVDNKNQHSDAAKDKEILNKTDKINKSETSRIKKGDLVKEEGVLKPPPTTENSADATAVQDPLSMRNTDTTQLKRIKPGSTNTETVSIDDDGGSDTVHLKVIKEKKKQLAGILTASQTIRLRPPSSGSDEPTVESSADSSGKTMKLKASDEKSSEAKSSGSAGTLKLKASNETSGEGTLKIKEPASTSEGTLKIKEPASGSQGTLKIKSSNDTASASGTLKMKAPVGDADKTASMTSAKSGGGTMKLSAKKTSTSVRPKTAQKNEEYTEEEENNPGVFFTLTSVAALVAISFMAFVTVSQWMELFVDKAV